MNVLITGAGGFIGRHLVRNQLARGRHVTAVDVTLDGLKAMHAGDELKLAETDFRSEALDKVLAEQDVCFHLASLHLEVGASEQAFHEVNVEGAQRFVERCHMAGVGRFVHCSSVGVFGDVRNPPANEETECYPDLVYERSKLDGERRVGQYGSSHGYPVVVVRPSWVYGPGCPRTLKLVRAVRSGRFFYVGDGSNQRHPIYIDDMIAGFELAATHPDAPGRVFIIAGPQAVTVRELVEVMADELGVDRPWVRLPQSFVWLGGLLTEVGFAATGREPPFSRRSLKFFSGNSAFDTSRAQRLLGFEARVELREGLRRTFGELKQAQAL